MNKEFQKFIASIQLTSTQMDDANRRNKLHTLPNSNRGVWDVDINYSQPAVIGQGLAINNYENNE